MRQFMVYASRGKREIVIGQYAHKNYARKVAVKHKRANPGYAVKVLLTEQSVSVLSRVK